MPTQPSLLTPEYPAFLTISLIIPTRNEASLIEDTLKGLQTLRRQGHEILLVDGESSDSTRELASAWVDQVLIQAPGRAIQMNAGAAAARGDILWFIHADTQINPASGQKILDAIEAGYLWGRFDVRLSGTALPLRLIEKMMNFRSCLTGIATGDQGIFVRRDEFRVLGGYATVPLMEDIELSQRLRRRGRPACLHHPVLHTSSRRWETRGIIRTIVLMWFLRFAYWLGAPAQWLVRWYR